jgi:chondroitin AC lyase
MAKCQFDNVSTSTRFLLLLVALMLLATATIAATIHDDFSIVRENVRKIMLWPTADQLPGVISEAMANLTALDMNTCKWPDLNYSTRGPENWDPVLHMFRISTMTAALTAPGGLSNDTRLSTAIHCALRVWIEEDWQNPNWWWNYIQDPLIATSIMLMLGVERMTKYEIDSFVNISYRANWWIKDWGGGANLVWELQVQVFRGLATSNYSAVAEGFELMWQTVQVQNLSAMGIQTDWSYHFHGSQLLSAPYGDAWATNILHFHLATRDTQYALSKDRIETFGRFLTRGDAWFTMGSVWTWGIIGRVIDRGVHVWYTHLFPSDQLRELAMDVTDNLTAVQLLDYADRLEHRHEGMPLVGNRHFYTSDFQVHRRVNWTAALKMHSTRVIATECDNNENLKGEHIGDGVLNLYTRDAQYGGGEEYENIFALLEWQAINGITVEADTPLNHCDGGRMPMLSTTFVGGVSDGMYGAAIMDTLTHNLTAKRTWHFYDDYIVALANGIEDNTTALLQTAVVSRLLPPADTVTGTLTIQWSNGTRAVLSDGIYLFPYSEPRVLWFHADGTAWSVLDEYETLIIDCRNKSGNVNEFGPWDFEMNGRLLTAIIVHGRGPTTEALGYKYIIMPNVTVESISTLWERYLSLANNAYALTCKQNNNESLYLHGTCDSILQRASVLLFDKGFTNGSKVYYNCSSMSLSVCMEQTGGILFSENSDSFIITAAHPTLATGTFAVSVNRSSVLTNECTSNSQWGLQTGTRVLLTLPGNSELLGKSVSVTCKKSNT